MVQVGASVQDHSLHSLRNQWVERVLPVRGSLSRSRRQLMGRSLIKKTSSSAPFCPSPKKRRRRPVKSPGKEKDGRTTHKFKKNWRPWLGNPSGSPCWGYVALRSTPSFPFSRLDGYLFRFSPFRALNVSPSQASFAEILYKDCLLF